MQQPYNIFIIYAREDSDYLKELLGQLRPLVNAKRINVWSDLEINPGMEWEKEIIQRLDTADIILLLVSSSYFNSAYIHEVEIKYALGRHEKGAAKVIPIIVRPVTFSDDPIISRLQVLPTDGKPVTDRKSWPERDDAWINVVAGVKKTLDALNTSKTHRNEGGRNADSHEENRQPAEQKAKENKVQNESLISHDQHRLDQKDVKIAHFEDLKAQYLPKLETALQKIQKLDTIKDLLKEFYIRRTKNKELGSDQLQQQLDFFKSKVQKAQFNITIIGTEGSGKSTFINALLKKNILPTGSDKRTTLTPVEIRAAERGQPSRSIITFKSKENFNTNLQKLKELISNPTTEIIESGTNAIEEEIKNLERFNRQILSHLKYEEYTLERNHEDLEQLKQSIEQYITDPIISRAVKNIVLYVKDFSFNLPDKEIIVQDLPGYDSPDKSHQQHTKEKLIEADLIIFVFSLEGRIDLNAAHIAMLSASDVINKAIKTSEKLFVFFNKIDKIYPFDEQNINQAIYITKKEWGKYADVEKNAVWGSAEGYLVEIGERSEDNYQILEKLTRFNINTGIQEIIKKVGHYFDHDRIPLLIRGIERLINASEEYLDAIKGYLLERHGNIERDVIFKEIDMFDKWWIEKCKEVTSDFYIWYYENFIKIQNSQSLSPMQLVMLQEYETIFEKNAGNIKIDKKKVKTIYINTLKGSVAQPTEANKLFRNEYTQYLLSIIEKNSTSLAEKLMEIIYSMMKWVSSVGFIDLPTILPYLENNFDSNKRNNYNSSIHVLINRFAIPIIRVFFENPYSSLGRNSRAEEYIVEIEFLFWLSENHINKYKQKDKDINNTFEIPSPQNTHYVLGYDANLQNKDKSINVFPPLNRNLFNLFGDRSDDDFEATVLELRQDVEVTIKLLKEPLFYASGVSFYCLQEIEKAKEFILNEINSLNFKNFIHDEYKRGNINVLQGIRKEFEIQNQNRERILGVYKSIRF